MKNRYNNKIKSKLLYLLFIILIVLSNSIKGQSVFELYGMNCNKIVEEQNDSLIPISEILDFPSENVLFVIYLPSKYRGILHTLKINYGARIKDLILKPFSCENDSLTYLYVKTFFEPIEFTNKNIKYELSIVDNEGLVNSYELSLHEKPALLNMGFKNIIPCDNFIPY